jgi:hypothetical protein
MVFMQVRDGYKVRHAFHETKVTQVCVELPSHYSLKLILINHFLMWLNHIPKLTFYS